MNQLTCTVAIGAALGMASLTAATRRSHFDGIAKAARVEARFNDLRAMLRSDGVRERAAFRVRGYGFLSTSCSVGLIFFGAANALHLCGPLANLAVVAGYVAASASLRARWYFLDRFSLAAENFNVYHHGFGHSYEPFEAALEKFRSLDAKSYAIASPRLRKRHKAACIEQQRVTESYVAGLRRMLK